MLSNLRAPELEGDITASLDESDPHALDMKMAALAANGTAKSLPVLEKYLLDLGSTDEGVKKGSAAIIRFAELAASLGDKDAIPALESAVCRRYPSANSAIADIDPVEAARYAAENWDGLDDESRVRMAFMTSDPEGIQDPALRKFVEATRGVAPVPPVDVEAVYKRWAGWLGDPREYYDSPAGREVVAFLAVARAEEAARIAYTWPDKGLAVGLARCEEAVTDPAARARLDCLRAIAGDKSAGRLVPSPDTAYLIAAGVTRDPGCLEVARRELRSDNGNRDAASFAISLAATDTEDRNLAWKYWTASSRRLDVWSTIAAQKSVDGLTVVRKMIQMLGMDQQAGAVSFLQYASEDPAIITDPTLQRIIVAKCADVPSGRIWQLNPHWCRQFGDQALKAKYASLVDNDLYADRIRLLKAFAGSGNARVLEKLKQTAERGLIDETVACIEIAATEPIDGDRLGFILGFAKDKRWRVREAVAYALRLVHDPRGDEVLQQLSQDPVERVAFETHCPAFHSHHRSLQPPAKSTPYKLGRTASGAVPGITGRRMPTMGRAKTAQ